MHEHTNNSIVKLTGDLALLAAGAVLMCLGTGWLFFVGLALVLVSGVFSLRPRTSARPLGLIMSSVAWIGAIVLFLWVSSLGREPLPWFGACAGVFAVGMTELGYWRANRRMDPNA